MSITGPKSFGDYLPRPLQGSQEGYPCDPLLSVVLDLFHTHSMVQCAMTDVTLLEGTIAGLGLPDAHPSADQRRAKWKDLQ